jgi:DNA-directed RNA polymerase subunit beta'
VTAFLDQLVQEFGAPAISQVLDAFKDLGFKYATQAGSPCPRTTSSCRPQGGDPRALREQVGASRTSTTRA